MIIEIKQACPRQCTSYELSNRMTLVGDDDNMGSMERIKNEGQRVNDVRTNNTDGWTEQ